MEEIKNLGTIDEIRAFSDPYRLQILNCFYNLGKPSTVKQVADKLGEVPAKIHYHVKKLENTGILRLTHTREVNGIIAKYYEPTAKKFSMDKSILNSCVMPDVLNETQRMVTAAYNTSQRIALDNIEGEETMSGGFELSMVTLCLTEDEYRNLHNVIIGVIEKYELQGQKRENAEEYHFFSCLLKTKKDRND